MSQGIGRVFTFADVEVDLGAREVRRNGVSVAVEPQVFDLISLLMSRNGQVVTKDEIIEQVWGGRFVSESAVSSRVNAARKALGDDGRAQRWIKTAHGIGFRFAPLEAQSSGDEALLAGSIRCPGVLMGEESATVERALGEIRALVEAATGAAAEFRTETEFSAACPSTAAALSTALDVLARVKRYNARAGPWTMMEARLRIDVPDAAAEPSVPSTTGCREIAVSAACHAALGNAADNRARLHTDGDYRYPADADREDYRAPQLEGLNVGAPDRPSIIVLPFACLPGDDAMLDVIAKGIRMDIQNALVKMSGLLLIATGAAQAMEGADPALAARQHGVRHVLEGTARRAGDRVRISVQLADMAAGEVCWSDTYDGGLEESFDFQDEVTERVVTSLDVKLASGEQARVWRKCIADPRIRNAYYDGMKHFLTPTPESYARARERFEWVAEAYPESPQGPSMAAMVLWIEATRGWNLQAEVARERSAHWAEIAVRSEDADGMAHTALGNIRLLQRRFDEALEIGAQAVAVRPGCTQANGFFANILLHCGEPARAIQHVRRAIRISPIYPLWFVEILAAAYREADELALSAAAAHEALRIAPESLHGRLILITSLMRAGRTAAAQDIATEVRAMAPSFEAGTFLAVQPFRNEAVSKSILADLSAAGLD